MPQALQTRAEEIAAGVRRSIERMKAEQLVWDTLAGMQLGAELTLPNGMKWKRETEHWWRATNGRLYDASAATWASIDGKL